ncbi:class A beta-lactamase BOR-1 [soil metagenome]
MATRRDVLGAGLSTGAGLLIAGCAGAGPIPDTFSEFEAVRAQIGGRLGICVIDTASGHRISFDARSRYAMCSTFKLPLVGAVLAAVDRGELALDRLVQFADADILEYAPIVGKARDHALSVEQLCAAAVTLSDNSAANLLLPLIGGPAGLTAFARGQGDAVFRLDRTEPTLNANIPGDPRDTTTPTAMAKLTVKLLTGRTLSPASRARLIGWMVASPTGAKRLRAGLPSAWKAGDKTGTSGQGAVNDVAIAWPTGRAPIVIVCFADAPGAAAEALEGAHRSVARLVATRFG